MSLRMVAAETPRWCRSTSAFEPTGSRGLRRSPGRWRAARRAGVRRSRRHLPSSVADRFRSPQRLAGTPGARVPARPAPVYVVGARPVPARRVPAPVCGCLPSQRGPVRSGCPGRRLALARGRPAPAQVAAEPGLVVEDVETGWCGAVVRVEKAGGMHVVHLEDRRGRTRGFPLGPGFLVDGAAGRAHAAPARAPRRWPRPGGGVADRERVDGGARPARPGGGGVAAVRRGPPRRRAGREGLG